LSTDEAEQILKEADALYYMQVGLIESVVHGHLYLTNLRIAFLEGIKKNSLLRIIRRKENMRPLINYSIARLMGANVVMRQRTGQIQSKSSEGEMQQLLVVELNTPTGPESFSFEVDDPEIWANIINTLTPTCKDMVSDSTQAIPPPHPNQQISFEKPPERKIKPEQKSVIEVGDVKFCPECGKELELSAKFCWECGSPQPEME
jgi:hypothetical protein